MCSWDWRPCIAELRAPVRKRSVRCAPGLLGQAESQVQIQQPGEWSRHWAVPLVDADQLPAAKSQPALGFWVAGVQP